MPIRGFQLTGCGLDRFLHTDDTFSHTFAAPGEYPYICTIHPYMAGSHIVPVMVGNPQRCKAISDELLLRFGIYVQPINYPTIPRGTERLRLTPTPLHSDEQIDRLVTALLRSRKSGAITR
jgi:hypothetical protein